MLKEHLTKNLLLITQGSKMNEVEEAMIDYWGERCQEYEEDCSCCQAWKEYDKLKGAENTEKKKK